MVRRLIMIAALAVFGTTSAAWAAEEHGTADEAKAMLEKVVEAVKADEAAALDKFTKGEDGFKDRDLYPFCGGPDGNFSAHPSLAGKSLKDLKDKADKPLGEEIYAAAKEGEINEVSYMWPRPGEEEPVNKIAYVTKIGDQVCAVGYYQ